MATRAPGKGNHRLQIKAPPLSSVSLAYQVKTSQGPGIRRGPGQARRGITEFLSPQGPLRAYGDDRSKAHLARTLRHVSPSAYLILRQSLLTNAIKGFAGGVQVLPRLFGLSAPSALSVIILDMI